jgi:hypothetical protein
MALQGKVVLQAGMDGSEFLKRLHLSEAEHGALASSQGRVAALDTIIGVAADVLFVRIA